MAEILRQTLNQEPPITLLSIDAPGQPPCGFEFGQAVVNIDSTPTGLPPNSFRAMVYASLGLSYAEIGQQTHRSINTVKSAMRQGYRRVEYESFWGQPARPRNNLARYFLSTGTYDICRLLEPMDLTPRDKSFLTMASLGEDYSQIAAGLNYARETINDFMRDIGKHTEWRGQQRIILAALLSGGIAVDNAQFQAVKAS